MLGCKIGDAAELQNLFFAECIADFYGSVVVNADNVSGKRLFHIPAVLCHEDGGICQGDLFADPVVDDLHSPAEFSRTYPDKRNAVPVGRVHIGLYFKGKPRKRFFIRRNFAGYCSTRTRRRRHFNKRIQHLLNAEIINGASEKDRCLTSF